MKPRLSAKGSAFLAATSALCLVLAACQPKPPASSPAALPSIETALANPEAVLAEYSSGDFADWKEWSAARDAWYKEAFGPCLKQSGIRMSCGSCASAYIKYLIQMDNSGRIAAMRKYKEGVCGRPAPPEFESCIENFYRARSFPSLKGKLFRATLGTGLSC